MKKIKKGIEVKHILDFFVKLNNVIDIDITSYEGVKFEAIKIHYYQGDIFKLIFEIGSLYSKENKKNNLKSIKEFEIEEQYSDFFGKYYNIIFYNIPWSEEYENV